MYYTLRVIRQDGQEFNRILGKEYALFHRDRFLNEKDWHAFLDEAGTPPVEGCFAAIQDGESSCWWFLHEGDENYIMTDSGQTFSQLRA